MPTPPTSPTSPPSRAPRARPPGCCPGCPSRPRSGPCTGIAGTASADVLLRLLVAVRCYPRPLHPAVRCYPRPLRTAVRCYPRPLCTFSGRLCQCASGAILVCVYAASGAVRLRATMGGMFYIHLIRMPTVGSQKMLYIRHHGVLIPALLLLEAQAAPLKPWRRSGLSTPSPG